MMMPLLDVCAQTVACVALLVVGAVDDVTAVPPLVGFLSAYGQVPTDATIAYRQSVGDLPPALDEFDVLLAVSDCGLIGRTGMLYTAVGPLKAIVSDCAADDGTPSWMAQNQIIAELDWYAWQRWPQLVGSRAILVMDQRES